MTAQLWLTNYTIIHLIINIWKKILKINKKHRSVIKLQNQRKHNKINKTPIKFVNNSFLKIIK